MVKIVYLNPNLSMWISFTSLRFDSLFKRGWGWGWGVKVGERKIERERLREREEKDREGGSSFRKRDI